MKLARVLAVLFLAALLLGGVFASLGWPYAGFEREVFVDIPRGTGSPEVGALLERSGVIRSRWQFALARILHPRTRLQAGEYRFAQAASVLDVFQRIARGDIFFYELAVPEGQNMFDIAASLEHLGVMQPGQFLEAAHDTAPIRSLDPGAPSLEGYLFPDTYRINRHTTPEQLCRQMVDRFRKEWAQIGAGRNVHDSVTLASLVEREARLKEERPLIASVFTNRLRLGMPLQCDPTTVYAALLENRFRGAIHRTDLESKHLYNTYQHAGLPPGPIANPGVQSLQAALSPAESSYIYFVVRPDGSGGHQFSNDLKQHQRAVQIYRRALNQTVQAPRVAAVSPAQAARRNH